MKFWGILPQPILRFRNGTATNPFNGYKMNLGPYKTLDEIRCVAFVNVKVNSDFSQFIDNFINGHRGYPGFPKQFDISVKYPIDIIQFSTINELTDIVESDNFEEKYDIAIVTVPEKMFLNPENDYYISPKRLFAKIGLPSQMVATSSVKYGANNPYLLFNFGLSVFTKAGGLPWTLHEHLSSDLFVGVDLSIMKNKSFLGITLLSQYPDLNIMWFLEENTGFLEVINPDVFKKKLQDALEYLVNESDLNINTITFHRDGTFFDSDILTIRSVIKSISEKLSKTINYQLIEIKKSGVPKHYTRLLEKYGVPEKGFYFRLDKYTYLLTTAGYPDIMPFTPSGYVNPLKITIVDSNYQPKILTTLRDILSLTELHFASGFRPPKLPITTLYAHRVAQFATAGVIPKKYLNTRLWFL